MITVNAQLISTETGAHVWADRFEGARSTLGQLQVEVVSRLANSLGVELVKAEALRAARERPNNPDAVDLAMQGWAAINRSGSASKTVLDDAVALFERALSIDAGNVPAMIGLANALTFRAVNFWSEDRDGDIARAHSAIDRALSIQPDNSLAHWVKSWVFYTKRQWAPAIAEAEEAIAEDQNNANAHATASFFKIFLGRSEEGFAGIETALRLSPRDTGVPFWQLDICALHAHLAQWDRAIEWCNKSIANNETWWALVYLAAANAWAGHNKEAKEAAAQLQKDNPGFTTQKWAGIHWTDDPTFNVQYQRITEGLRKAGLPEGEKTN
jgi:tetratricopeptide (TPR) repeat protein